MTLIFASLQLLISIKSAPRLIRKQSDHKATHNWQHIIIIININFIIIIIYRRYLPGLLRAGRPGRGAM